VLTDEAHNLAGGALWPSEEPRPQPRRLYCLEVHHTWEPTPFTCNFWSWSLVLQTCMDSAHLAQSHTQAINQSHPELPHPKRFFMSPSLLQADRAPAACLPQPTTRSPAMIRPQLQQSEAMAWHGGLQGSPKEESYRFAIQHPFPNKNRSTDVALQNSYPSIIATLTGCPGLLHSSFCPDASSACPLPSNSITPRSCTHN
jgi:hypothetical protein